MRKLVFRVATLALIAAVGVAYWRRHPRMGAGTMNEVVNPFLVQGGISGVGRAEVGTLEHVGRSSGTVRLSPVHPVLAGDSVRITVPLGLQSEWARNVLAAGHCRMQLHGTVYELVPRAGVRRVLSRPGGSQGEPVAGPARLEAMQARPLVVLAAASILLLGACSGGVSASPSPGPSSSPTSGPGRQGLEGRTFVSTAIDGRTLVAGSRVRLSFQSGQVSASAGCNSMGGPYTIGGNRLVARQLSMTEMACNPALMAQDQWLIGLLDGAAIALDGDTLTLAKDGVRLTLLDREVADPDRPLLGTRWVVDSVVSGAAVSSLPAGVVAALTFTDGRVDVETGCNRGGGAVTITGATLTFGPIALTKMACAADVMAVERAVTAVLSGQIGYTIDAAILTLDAGARGLILRATP